MSERLALDIYTGLADIGKVITFIIAFVATLIIIGIFMSKNKPEKVKPLSKKAMILPSIIVLTLLWGLFYMTYRYKAFATYEGVETIFNNA
jgi:hypothetical protein